MMRYLFLSLFCIACSTIASAEEGAGRQVMIGSELFSVEVQHNGRPVTLMRNQDPDNRIDELYQRTNQGKVQPMHPFAPHAVETIGELEMIDYLVRRSGGDESILVVDSRTPTWTARGMIPGAVNIPFTEFRDTLKAAEIMEEQFGVQVSDVMDFSEARTLVMYCNGAWCGQSPAAIRQLLKLGYPAAKIKYYRGGMQSWHSLGLTVVKP